MYGMLHEVYCISIQIASVINLNDTQNESSKNIFCELAFLILFQLQSGCFVKVYLCHLSSLLTLRCGKKKYLLPSSILGFVKGGTKEC